MVNDMVQFATDNRLPVVGLMCIPHAQDYPAPHFALLRKLAHQNGLTQLSMGMSGNYIGTEIFGVWNKK